MAEQTDNENGVEVQNQLEAASGVIINAAQIQSIDISERFTRTKTEAGWHIQLEAAARITINFMTSMRKLEVALLQNDCIERDGDDVIFIRKQTADAYRSQRGTSASQYARSINRMPVTEMPSDKTV